MSPVLVLLWLSAEPPSAPERATLEAWARARGVALVDAPPAEPRASYDAELVLRIEQGLEQARKAISTLDPRAQSALDELEALLAAHAELPQAAWLEAERKLLAAELLQRTTEGAPQAAEQRSAARALEGRRADTFDAEPGGASPDAPPSHPLPALALRRGDELYVDGRGASPSQRFAAGRHQLQLYRADVLVLAEWTELGPERGHLAVAMATACSRTDLAGTEAGSDGPLPDPGVRCPSWVAARAAPQGGLQLARCERSQCEGWSLLGPSAPAALLEAPPAERDSGSWLASPWVSWGAALTGVALVTTVVLWQAGAFDGRERAPEFVFTGPSAAALRF